jgi:hypothetical protein
MRNYHTYELLPLRKEVVNVVAERAYAALDPLLHLVDLISTEEAHNRLPKFAYVFMKHMDLEHNMVATYVESGILRSVLGESRNIPDIEDLRFWRTALENSSLLFELLVGINDFYVAQGQALLSRNDYFDKLKSLPKTKLGKAIASSILLQIPIDQVQLGN